jgi:hypothetical protein
VNQVISRRFEKKDTPFGLGRHVQHDSRSRGFTFAVPATPAVHKTILWPHGGEPLNQLQTEACTGNAIAQLFNCDIFEPVRVAKGHGLLAESAAMHFYGLGTHLDGGGEDQFYPPHDDGGTGLGVAKAAQQLGYIDRYLHCFTFAQLQAAIQTQPVIVGTSWTNPMFSPDPVTGLIGVGALTDATVVGGHEWLLLGIDYERTAVVGLNSWGSDWGGGPGLTPGMFRVSFNDFQALMADDGDITVPHGIGLPG